MASHVVIATDLRRTTVKVAPGTYLVDVLQEACARLHLASDRFLLRHKQRQLDLAVPWRASGLLPGAKLELVQKANTPSAVQIALQLPPPDAALVPGGRLIRRFPADLTLWKVLRQFESADASPGRALNMTARAVAPGRDAARGPGQLYYETPVLNIMGRELSTFADFQKTLSQLGHNSGNVLVRLSYRATQQTLVEAMEHISQFFKDADADAAADGKPERDTPAPSRREDMAPPRDAPMADAPMTDASVTDAPVVDAPAAPAHASSEARQPPAQPPPAAPTTAHQRPSEAAASADPFQPVNVFLAPTGPAPAAALTAADEADFAPTVAHAQLHQARLLESSRNKRLPSDKELEDKAAAEAARVAAIKSVLVKVRFPDNTSSEWQVGPPETGAFLHEAVRRVMASPARAFRLVLPGSKTVIQDDDAPSHGLIRGYKLSGRVLVNLVWDDGVPPDARRQPFLQANVAQRAQPVKVPELPAAQDDGDPAPSQQPRPPPADRGDGKADGGGKKMPKWFKLGKK